MGKFDGVLICTDLDGTLYRNDKTISLENREAIDYFKSEGGCFTFITGRLPYYSMDAYNAVKPNVPFGCANGAGLYDGALGKYVWTHEMSKDAIKLAECIDKHVPNLSIQVCGFYNIYFSKDNRASAAFRRITGLPQILRSYNEVDEPFAKIIFVSGNSEELSEAERVLKAHPISQNFEFVRSERSILEILTKGMTKGVPLAKLTEHMNLDINKTIAIGDYYNDVGMLKAAGLGIAVSNACEPALEAADHVTVSNEEHAIARVIYDLEAGNITFKAQ